MPFQLDVPMMTPKRLAVGLRRNTPEQLERHWKQCNDLVALYKQYEKGPQMSLVSRGGQEYATPGPNEPEGGASAPSRSLGSGEDGATVSGGVQCGLQTGCSGDR